MRDDSGGGVNRLVVSVLAIAVMLTAVLAVLLAWLAADEAIRRLYDSVDFLAEHNDRDGKIVLTLIAVVVILVMVCVLLLELLPPRNRGVAVANVRSGTVAITTQEIAARVQEVVRGAPGISDAVADVTRRGNRVEVVLDLHLDPGADVAQAADEGCRRTQTLIEDELHIELAARPRARVHYRELRLQSAPTGWERPGNEETRDSRGSAADASEEAQA